MDRRGVVEEKVKRRLEAREDDGGMTDRCTD